MNQLLFRLKLRMIVILYGSFRIVQKFVYVPLLDVGQKSTHDCQSDSCAHVQELHFAVYEPSHSL
ncbi:hypothetical protein MIR68_009136 [Amoeboaphelidium protococcarum]|nr:hypothetical protein MIR68_009136 [Amoeboaphelidium protococcarum]